MSRSHEDATTAQRRILPKEDVSSVPLGFSARVRRAVKRLDTAYRLIHAIRRRQQDRQIKREMMAYRALAHQRGIRVTDQPDRVFDHLHRRLLTRGLTWPPRMEGPLHVLYVGIPTDWERHNIPDQFASVGKVTCFFLADHGIPTAGGPETRRIVDHKLGAFVTALHAGDPITLAISYLSGSYVLPATIERIARLGIPIFGFHLDDIRSFRGINDGYQWSGPAAVCRAYDLNLTNAPESCLKYQAEGGLALFWPEGANPLLFKPASEPVVFRYDVTFVGKRYGERPKLVRYLRSRGLDVECFGDGWPNGYRSIEGLIDIVTHSRVSLGSGFVNESSFQVLKGRDFEIPSCGAAYLTSHHTHLGDVYRIGTEIETYDDFADCAQKAEALLRNEERTARLRAAARAAVVARHSWARRLCQLIDCDPTYVW